MQLLNTYLSQIYTVCRYFSATESPQQCKSVIKTDTIKCILIASGYSMIMRFAIGRVHYTRYFKWGIYGGLFGFAYSFYFTSQKANVFKIRKQMGLNELEN